MKGKLLFSVKCRRKSGDLVQSDVLLQILVAFGVEIICIHLHQHFLVSHASPAATCR